MSKKHNIYNNNYGQEVIAFINDLYERNNPLTKIVQDLKEKLFNSGVHELKLRSCEVELKHLEVLVEALKNNKIITHLNLAGNNLGTEGAKLVATLLKTTKTITHLSLAGNNLRTEGARLIAEELKHNKTVTHINLAWNNLASEGTQLIAEALEVNKTITHIDLSFNKLQNNGAKFIANCLNVNRHITHINVNDNEIEECAIKILQEATQGKEIEVHFNSSIEHNKTEDTSLTQNIQKEENEISDTHLEFVIEFVMINKAANDEYYANIAEEIFAEDKKVDDFNSLDSGDTEGFEIVVNNDSTELTGADTQADNCILS